MHVLIAVDDSKESKDAVETAHRLFGDDTDYTVVSVRPQLVPTVSTFGVGTYSTGSDLLALLDSADAPAQDTVDAAAEELPNADIKTQAGPVGPTICNEAVEVGADVIVVGTHDKNLIKRLLDGSTSRYLIENAPCPVLVVR